MSEILKECEYCGKVFETDIPKDKWCSAECSFRSIKNKYKKTCECCGKEFRTNIQNKKYCTQYCAGKARHQKQAQKKMLKESEILEAKTEAKDLVPITEINVIGHQKFIGREIPVIEGGFGEGKRCLTDKAIAEIHNSETKEIRKTINRNISRFKVGIDYIDLKVGNEITNNLLKQVNYTNMEISKAEHIYLLSERGYAKLIKIMDTDLAWEIHDELIDRYFSMRQELKETTVSKLTRKQELAIIIIEGGNDALEASKELAEIERKEAEEKAKIEAEKERRLLELEHETEIAKERASRNQMIGVTTVVETLKDVLGIKELNSVLFNRWLAEEKNLGEYAKYPGEKKRRFEPNEDFFRWVALEGYSFTGKTRDGRKTNVQYSTAMVERIVNHHAGSLIKFVRVNTAINKKDDIVIDLSDFDI